MAVCMHGLQRPYIRPSIGYIRPSIGYLRPYIGGRQLLQHVHGPAILHVQPKVRSFSVVLSFGVSLLVLRLLQCFTSGAVVRSSDIAHSMHRESRLTHPTICEPSRYYATHIPVSARLYSSSYHSVQQQQVLSQCEAASTITTVLIRATHLRARLQSPITVIWKTPLLRSRKHLRYRQSGPPIECR
jgi:hypothetical protein